MSACARRCANGTDIRQDATTTREQAHHCCPRSSEIASIGAAQTLCYACACLVLQTQPRIPLLGQDIKKQTYNSIPMQHAHTTGTDAISQTERLLAHTSNALNPRHVDTSSKRLAKCPSNIEGVTPNDSQTCRTTQPSARQSSRARWALKSGDPLHERKAH